MPPDSARRKRPAVSDSSESHTDNGNSDAATENSADDYESESSRRSRPRRRIDAAADASTSTNGTVARGPRALHDDAHHKPGAVVRVSVKNFGTYGKGEFFPGPYLNMVIGPNGTGKSTLGRALCIGLAFSHKLLANADSVSAFVKHGEDEAWIEIELKRSPNEATNPVIRAKLNKDNNSQKFWLNGKEVPMKRIQRLTQRLNIQIDNVCQFLPQERVAEFAKLSEIDLLQEMLRAAASAEVLTGHGQLKALYKDLEEHRTRVREDENRVERLEQTLRSMQQDVDKFRDREAAMGRIKLLEAAIEAAHYQTAVTASSNAKQRMKRAKAKVKALEEENDPTLQRVTQMKTYRDRLLRVVESRKANLRAAETSGTTLLEAVAKAEEAVNSRDTQIESHKKAYDERKKELQKQRTEITTLEGQLRSERPKFNAAEWRSRIRSEDNKEKTLRAAENDLLEKFQSIERNVTTVKEDYAKLQREAKQMKTLLGQREVFLKHEDWDAYTAWKWLNEDDNKGKFSKEVFGPPLLSCSMKDLRYADQVQAFINKRDMYSFLVQTPSDYKKFTDCLFREKKLNFSVRTFSGKRSDFQSPGRAEDFGFDGWAIDYLEGPDLMLAYLCSVARLHKIGVSHKDVSTDQFKMLERQEQVMEWATGSTLYKKIYRREYGEAGRSTSTRPIRPAPFWKEKQDFDRGDESQFEERRDSLLARGKMLVGEKEQVEEQLKHVQAELKEKGDLVRRLKKEKNQLQQEQTKYDSLPRDIERAQGERNLLHTLVLEMKEEYNNLVSERHELFIEQLRAALAHKDHLPVIWSAHQALVEAQLLRIQADSDVRGLEARNKAIVDQCEEEKRNAVKADEEYRKLKAEGTRRQDIIAEIRANASEEFTLAFVKMGKERPVDDLEGEAAAEKMTIESMNIPFDTIERFNQSTQERDAAASRLARNRGKMGTLQGEIDDVRSRWEPQVDQLVGNVNDAFRTSFERISCAGEVQLHKDEDFSKWALRLMVSFR